MKSVLEITAGQYSDKGTKPVNQDCYGLIVPEGHLLENKGIAMAIADGISSSEYGQEASHACVKGFLEDYFSTPESWSVKKSAQQVLTTLNTWLYGQGTHREQAHRGRVSTLSILVLKSTTAHVIHIGDSRIYRLRHGKIQLLTVDHKTWVSKDRNYLSRAMGADTHLEIDYSKHIVETGDIYILTTDGVHEYLDDKEISHHVLDNQNNLDKAAEIIVHDALANGSEDNVTCQVLRVDSLPSQNPDDVFHELTELPFPPELTEGMILDGYRIVRELYATNRTQLYLAIDTETGMSVALKTPSVNYEDDPAYIERFILEEWIGRRIDNAHVVKVYPPTRRRRFLYHVTEYLQGTTLRQWMHDHPKPKVGTVRKIVVQIIKGLRAFHRLEMLHQDLKPENIMIDNHGTVRLVDFGSTKVAGIAEIATPVHRSHMLGTKNYTAPEYATGSGTTQSDLYSLGVITYEMLTGKLPYGEMPDNWNKKYFAQDLEYTPIADYNKQVPNWINAAIKKAVAAQPAKRYHELSEFQYDLKTPNTSLATEDARPLIDRNPVAFWKGLCLILTLIIFYLLAAL